MPSTDNDKENRNFKILILLLLLITVIAVGVTIWALFFRDTAPTLAPDYAPVEEEVNAQDIEGGDEEEKMSASQGGGAVSMTYQMGVTVSLSGQKASLLFQNPSKSVNDVILQLIIVGADGVETIIAQSGTIKPGKKVETLSLIEDAAVLSEGTYSGRFNILYYDPDSGEKALVNSSIDGIEIEVVQ